MDEMGQFPLSENQAALWFLGQAGYVFRAGDASVVIDPYLSDSAANQMPECVRQIPVPIPPEDLQADVYLVTHDHADHLDPETIRQYRHKASTVFVAPRLAARRLAELSVPADMIQVVDSGQEIDVGGIRITGVFALPTSPDVLDTTGYEITFANGRSIYHTSDTAYTPLLIDAAPKGSDVLLVPINGKWRNLTIDQALDLTAAVGPRYVLPNHYDMMEINTENPETFRLLLSQRGLSAQCVIPTVMRPFVWE